MCRHITTKWGLPVQGHLWKYLLAQLRHEIIIPAGLHLTLCTSESVLLHHVSREALAAEGAERVDTSVVADVAFVYQALVHVLHLNRTLHCVLHIPLLADGEGLLGVRAVRYCSAWREWLMIWIAACNSFINVPKGKQLQQ